MYLFKEIEVLKKVDRGYKELPKYIPECLNQKFAIRPYQEDAFRNFITYFETEKLYRKPYDTLFHMATGSGKTLIMAGLMTYLYDKGYRDFLFFVHLDNIVQKTKDNFLNKRSSKYLFSNTLNIKGKEIEIKEISTFEESSDNCINVCFSTIHGLHNNLKEVKENAITLDDFRERKIVFISDEAHHLNAETYMGNKIDEAYSWERTVDSMFNSNPENVMLKFTATCDLNNPLIETKYKNKIIYDYPLRKFREDGYSKEVKTLQSDIPLMDRAIQAIMMNQYRLKVFQDYKLSIKPVILFKNNTIKNSKTFFDNLTNKISELDGNKLKSISQSTNNDVLKKMYSYFADREVTFERLAQEIKEDFGPEHCIDVNSSEDAENKQMAVNNLERKDNPYRAVFAVDKLNEGWDVLNLFDIVRLYETRDSKNNKPGKSTMAEAQLIGRGARYCPFIIDDSQEMHKRKYDGDLNNPLRICEEFYYHCQYNSRYISELNIALKEVGIIADNVVEQQYIMKPEFKLDPLYEQGLVFINEREEVLRDEVIGILESVKDKTYGYTVHTGKTAINTIFENVECESLLCGEVHTITIKDIAAINYNIVHSALRKYPNFAFNVLKSHYPNLKTIKEFIEDTNYLGDIQISINGIKTEPTTTDYYNACFRTLGKISEGMSNKSKRYKGTKEFRSRSFKDVFKEPKRNYTDPHGYGEGISQNDSAVPSSMRLDLSREDWFIYEDNYGTDQEKKFIAEFYPYVKRLKTDYDKVYLVRNERELHIYSFKDGERFEPDFLIFLQKNKEAGTFEQWQIFVEPKGDHLIENDKWKEDFLLQIEEQGKPVTIFMDNSNYRVKGFPFFNENNRMKEFRDAMDSL